MTIPNISVKFFENSYQVEFSSALIYIYFHSSSFFHSFSIFLKNLSSGISIRFGTELASIGTGNEGTKKPEGNSFGRTTNNKYELWTTLVKNFHLEASYLSAIVDNSANILIADFYPNNEFIAVIPCPILRPCRESETIFIIGTIAPSLVSVSFEVLILKVKV